ncbi:MAG TPA: hypothetical protein ENK43_08730 [Planctomycetes bacterium]|nr:hypothetical protein [Planctomycetota bacterium]
MNPTAAAPLHLEPGRPFFWNDEVFLVLSFRPLRCSEEADEDVHTPFRPLRGSEEADEAVGIP